MNKQEILKELTQCTGSENYYKHWLGIVFTDGVKTMAELCGAYWLIDLVASHQNPRVRKESFQVWTLRKAKTAKSWRVDATDGNDNKIAFQRIPFSDFPLDEIKLYVCDGVLMLTNEY